MCVVVFLISGILINYFFLVYKKVFFYFHKFWLCENMVLVVHN